MNKIKILRIVIRVVIIAGCVGIGLLIARWIWGLDIPEWLKVLLIAS